MAGQNEILIGHLCNLIRIRSNFGWPLQKIARKMASGQLLFSDLNMTPLMPHLTTIILYLLRKCKAISPTFPPVTNTLQPAATTAFTC